MKNFSVLIGLAALLATPAFAQTSAGQANNQNPAAAELPSAPSAVAMPKEPAPATKPTPQNGAANAYCADGTGKMSQTVSPAMAGARLMMT